MHTKRFFALVMSFAIALASSVSAEPIHIAAWNVEHLNEDNDAGCIPRSDDDYEYIAGRIADLNADVVAIQEVESAKAAYRVFPESKWLVVMSDRPNNRGSDSGAICWGTEDKRLRHQATGIAIRRDVNFDTNPSYAHLAGDNPNQRWGTDVTIHASNVSFRVLSVHLASGCWGAEQDGDSNRSNICTTLRGQVARLAEWIEERNANSEDFVVLGDFNRRLAISDDWAAAQLLDPSLNTTLVTSDVRDGVEQADWCDARYPDLIDHILASNTLVDHLKSDSVIEHPRIRESPDHCIISAVIE
ncbi:MAG: endonuclease/exonuclease/phosphatase family protein [Gammaproteobacteria bacterium]|nr:endonuclease/exonuclease/phosphatase family protein [Gammaproteobacteria bacterium]